MPCCCCKEPIANTANIDKGSTEVAARLKDIDVVSVDGTTTLRLGSLWEGADGPVVFKMFRRWG